MNRLVEPTNTFAKHVVRLITGIALLVLLCSFPVFSAPGQDSAAREQFASAVRMRTMLEGYLEKDRSIADYKQTIAAYHKVYTISTESDEVTPALIAEAELYEEMGRLYDPKFYQSAINSYNFLIEEYPDSQYYSTAILAIGRIQKDDLKKLDDAQATFEAFLKKYPHSQKAADARKALKEIAAALASDPNGAKSTDSSSSANSQAGTASPAGVPPKTAKSAPDTQAAVATVVDDDPAVAGDRVEPRALQNGLANVKDVQTKNSVDSSRIILTLDETIDFQSARIESPDRIYFNVTRATIGPKLAVSKIDLADGLLKSVRVAQNKPDVVRIVLDAPGAKDFTAFLLTKPYRLVIELQTKPITIASASTKKPLSPAVASAVVANAKTTQTLPVSDKAAADVAATLPVVGAPKTTRVSLSRGSNTPSSSMDAPIVPKPTHDGDTSLTRALGLKINRIVIDAGHGGHDTGTVGPHGLLEKDLCLDVALRLGKIIEQKLPGADVIYTRKDDSFVALEDRTKIANDAKADLFISIHANSSQDPAARGVETYYLNFATSDDAMAVAARENALAQESVHDLQDVLQKIARNDKISESRELAGDVQSSLAQRMAAISTNEKNRGVKKAPFVVLIGADMPSVLSEISFVSNPSDERLLKKTDQRQRIADGLYRGIASYLDSLNSLSYNKQKFISDNRLDAGNAAPAPTSTK